MDNNDNGTNAASSENNNSQFVMYWANNIARIVPNTAAAPPRPANEPTDFPECRSLGIV